MNVSSDTTGRIAVFGDVGGHFAPYTAQLAELGCDPGTGTVPDGLTIIQAGDLVHRGPDSDSCVRLADRFLTNSPGRYIQLLGNHEGHEIGGPMMAGFENEVSAAEVHTLLRWWVTRTCRIAVAIDTVEHGPMVVVHGGVTPWLWEALGGLDAAGTVNLLNSTVGGESMTVFTPGVMLSGGYQELPVGPVWAESTGEVYEAWDRAGGAPFGQVHGHSSPYVWRDREWRSNASDRVIAAGQPDHDRRHLTSKIAGRTFIGIDPGHGRYPTKRWAPLILEGAVTAV